MITSSTTPPTTPPTTAGIFTAVDELDAVPLLASLVGDVHTEAATPEVSPLGHAKHPPLGQFLRSHGPGSGLYVLGSQAAHAPFELVFHPAAHQQPAASVVGILLPSLEHAVGVFVLTCPNV